MRASGPRRGVLRVPSLPVKKHPPAPLRSAQESLDLVASFIERGQGKTVVLTGAGVSVDSGIRAYRGPNGSYTRAGKAHAPIYYHEFVASEPHRRRYWARSFLGYVPVRAADPNPTHYAIAAMQTCGAIGSLITQNVDGLHHKAIDSTFATYLSAPAAPFASTSSLDIPHAIAPPASRILELHGTLRHVHCLTCQETVGRDAFQDRLSNLNPEWKGYLDRLDQGVAGEQRFNPDGDVELGPGVEYDKFIVPPCDSCGGPMKPKVTFFGESLTPRVRDMSMDWVAKASNLLVIGSSLATFSAFRLISAYRASKGGKGEVGMINVGESRGDGAVDWRIGTSAGDILPDVGRRLLQTARVSRGLDWATKNEVSALLSSGVVRAVKEGSATA